MEEKSKIDKKGKTNKIHSVIEWGIRMVLYAVILIVISLIFPKTVYIDRTMFGLWAIFSAILISILNQTIKPLLFWLTVPLTGITLGLFYPFINLFILKIVSMITFGHFEIHGIFFAVLVAFIISVFNLLIDGVVAKLIRKER